MPRGRPHKGLTLRAHKATGVWYVTNPDTRREKYFTKDREASQALFEQWLLDRARQTERKNLTDPQSPPLAYCNSPQSLIVTTVADAFNVYLQWLHQGGKHRSYLIVKGIVLGFGRYIPLQTRLDTLGKMDFRAYRDALWKKVASEKLKRSYANRRFRIVKAAFRRAYRESDQMVNGEGICSMLSVLETRREKDATGATAITPAEFHAIATADDAQWKAIIYLTMNCALGNTDIARLQRDHIDLKNGMMHFSRPKTEDAADRPRHTPLWPETTEAMKVHLKTPRSQNLLFTTVRGNAWVQCSGRMINDEVAKKFRRIIKSLKLERAGLSFYSIRHAAAEWAADTPGVDTVGIKFLLGHATAEMWGKYVTRVPDRLQKAVEGIRAKLFSSPGPDDQESSGGSQQGANAAQAGSLSDGQGSKDTPEATRG